MCGRREACLHAAWIDQRMLEPQSGSIACGEALHSLEPFLELPSSVPGVVLCYYFWNAAVAASATRAFHIQPVRVCQQVSSTALRLDQATQRSVAKRNGVPIKKVTPNALMNLKQTCWLGWLVCELHASVAMCARVRLCAY